MEFGLVEEPGSIDPELPPDHPITARTLARVAPAPRARIRCGLPVWNERWEGLLYPDDGAHRLTAYARIFDTVEVNSTFHHPPAPEMIARWRALVPPSFRFVVKVWKNLSHQQVPRPDDVAQFLETARAFGDQMDVCFLQLPPHADLTWRRSLARLIDLLAPHVPLAIELRHPDWFRVEPTRTRLLEHLAERRVGMVITDTPAHRELIHMAVPHTPLLVRFRGCDGHPLDHARIEAWVARIEAWIAAGLRELDFIAHESDHLALQGVPVIARLAERLGGRDEIEIVKPPALLQLPLL